MCLEENNPDYCKEEADIDWFLNQLFFTVHTLEERVDFQESLTFNRDTQGKDKKPVIYENKIHAQVKLSSWLYIFNNNYIRIN